ncbi:uncharacterized protein LOC131436111 [Malaya genurostris]|uniref:uncharacterized protein LOC131436111 n=1 Tax=Malaya genurostris TaxID=325434 RepID=UPI0026F38B62|nr:uncharacterized protein LOC131436111 [Malaya genurostris]
MDFEKICRLCCQSIYRLNSIHIANDIPTKDLFSDILRLEISVDDNLPQQICEMCLSTLTEMHDKIEAFRENDRILRLQLLGDSTIDIKEEAINIDEKYTPTDADVESISII